MIFDKDEELEKEIEKREPTASKIDDDIYR